MFTRLKKIIFTGLFVLFFVGVIILAFFGKKTVIIQPNQPLPTPTPIYSSYIPNGTNIALKNTIPANKSTNVSVDQEIILTFNKAITGSDITFSIVPSIPFDATSSGNMYIITPNEPFFTNTTYTYFVTIKGLPTYTNIFSTIKDPTVTAIPDFASDIQNEINKHNQPDLYLAGYTPYNTNDFTVVSEYSDTTNSFSFTVTYYVSQQQAQQEFTSWVLSLGLTSQQLKLLHVSYQEATPGF